MKNWPKVLLPVFALCWVPARAETILYTDSGTFPSSVPTSDFTAPGETCSFEFEANSNPTPSTLSDVGMGGFDFPFSDFSYSLDGSPVAITPTFIRFFSEPNGGGFEICFDGTTAGTCADELGTGFSTIQMYTGMTSAPTLSTGALNLTEFGGAVDFTGFNLPDTTVLASPVP